MSLVEPIRSRKQLKQLADYWLKRGNFRNYTLIVLGVCTVLRPSDLLRLQWTDVYDFERGGFLSHITVTEHKTSKRKTIALNAQAIKALNLYFPHRRGEYIFSNNRRDEKAINRVTAWRIVKEAVFAIGIMGSISLYSLRKSFGYFAYKAGVLPILLMDLFNHSSFEVTRRYLGIQQEDRDAVYLSMILF